MGHFAENARGCADERGQATAVFIAALSALLVCIALAMDMGMANFERVRCADMVQQAESECLLPATAVKVKNSDAPGPDMCRALIDSLRRQGYEGAVTAYYYEPTQLESGLGAEKRVYVFGVQVEAETTTLVGAAFGTHAIPTRILAWSHAQPYSSYMTYRPSVPSNGVMRVAAGEASASATWTPVSTLNGTDMPGGAEELERAIAEAAA